MLLCSIKCIKELSQFVHIFDVCFGARSVQNSSVDSLLLDVTDDLFGQAGELDSAACNSFLGPIAVHFYLVGRETDRSRTVALALIGEMSAQTSSANSGFVYFTARKSSSI